MSSKVAVIGVLLVWFALVTFLAPILLSKKTWLLRRPRLGLITWFTLLLSATFAFLGAVEVVGVVITNSWISLAQTTVGLGNFPVVLVQSVGPWLTLSLIGGLLVVANQRLEPFIDQAKELRSSMLTGLPVDSSFESVPLSWLAVETPIAFVTKVDGRQRIIVTLGARARLSEPQLEAVLWHELGHIWGMHNSIKRVSYLIGALFPRLRVSQVFKHEVELLCELEADSFARRHVAVTHLEQARASISF
jgi:Zn-dependent protease with chaperone function